MRHAWNNWNTDDAHSYEEIDHALLLTQSMILKVQSATGKTKLDRRALVVLRACRGNRLRWSFRKWATRASNIDRLLLAAQMQVLHHEKGQFEDAVS